MFKETRGQVTPAAKGLLAEGFHALKKQTIL